MEVLCDFSGVNDLIFKMWILVENIRVMSGMAELAIFTALLYWFFTSSRVADMLDIMTERVGGWCGARVDEPAGAGSLRRLAQQQRRRHQDLYSKIDSERASRAAALFRVKESAAVPAPVPPVRPPAGLACARCAPLSRESWHEPAGAAKFRNASVINILDIGRQTYANGGVVSRYLCDLVQCCNLRRWNYPNVVGDVVKDEQFQRALEETTQAELRRKSSAGGGGEYAAVRRAVEARAMRILKDISSAMSNTVLRLVAWLCHKAVRRVAGGGCGTRAACVDRLRRAAATGLPLVFVPLHRSHLDYILVTFTLYLTGIRPPLVAAGDNLRIPLFGWFLRGCGAFYIRRRVEGSEYHGDPIYKTALRAFIINSLAEKNNLEFFIEGGRTRTGKPQLPKAGILSVIMDAYLEGTIEDALLVPVTVNYDKLVDGNFVREQLGMPKQMETFWSALKGIWHMMNTNHGSIRVDFNQPMSLKELATSFQKYKYQQPAGEGALAPAPPNNNLALSLDRRILLNHSNSSLYGADVSAEHKIMVEAIGRHLVYDAASATAIMCTNLVAHALLTELRGGGALSELCGRVEARARELRAAGRDLAFTGETGDVVCRAIDMLGPGLVRRDASGDQVLVRPVLTVEGALELSYYANTLTAHYAAQAIVVTALESLVRPESDGGAQAHQAHQVRHADLMEASIQLCEILSEEFILSAPCQRIEDLVAETVDEIVAKEILCRNETEGALEEERWSRRFAKVLEEEEEDGEGAGDSASAVKYTLGSTPQALAERRRLLLTLRPLVEAYSATCDHLADTTQKIVVKATLDDLLQRHKAHTMPYGEAVSTDAIRNCLRLLKLWGVVDTPSEQRERLVRVRSPYQNKLSLDTICCNVTKFNTDSPLLRRA